jgi:hypothetical protein
MSIYFWSCVMPQIERPIKDSGLTIIRPVAKAVIRQVCEAVGIDPRVAILFPDSKGVVEQPGSTMESKDNTPKFNSDEYISIVVEDKPGFEGGVYYETRHKSETPPVFSDPALGLFLAPIVSNRELFINITYHTQDGPKTLQEVGEVFGLTRMRICQIEKAIFEKISIKE